MTKPTAAHVRRILEAVHEEVAHILESASFQKWADQQKLKQADLIAFNNSFLYRDGVAAGRKNAKYLCVAVDQVGKASSSPSVATANRINASFKRVPSRQIDQLRVCDAKSAIEEELQHLGMIVRVLVARVGNDEPVEVELEGVPHLEILRYDPALPRVVEVHGSTLSISRLDDIDVVWRAAKQELTEDSGAALSEHFEDLFADIRESAGQPVDIDDVDEDAPSILSGVIERIDAQVAAYETALAGHLAKPDSVDSYNELLRIAYNFADGARAMITLVIGISDLKPVLSWLSIGAQFDLADRFGELPFATVGKAKPSLARYRAVIAGARNQAFHDVFSFERPFHARLTGDAFMAPEIRLFQEYSRRNKPTLDFRDRELIELLANFTRASERGVPLGFWEGNLAVMRAVANLARSIRRAIILACT